jgi:hypothetical protein
VEIENGGANIHHRTPPPTADPKHPAKRQETSFFLSFLRQAAASE